MKKMMKVSRYYEKIFGKLINITKSLVYLHEKIPITVCNKIRNIIRVRQGTYPFYLS